MKRFLIVATIAISLAACSKSNNREGMSQITGQWEHRKDIGGIMAYINYPVGNGNIQVFDGNGQFKAMYAGAVVRTGTYQIKASGRANKWLLSTTYTFNSQPQTRTDTVMFEGNQLIYLPEWTCCDMQTMYYERVSEHP